MKIAQVNIAKMKAPMDSPIMVDFVNNLDHINNIAEKSPGFVWRLKDDTNNATSIKIFDDEFLLVNMSVWDNMDHLFEYVYNSMHGEILKRKKEWFHKMGEMHMAICILKIINIHWNPRLGKDWNIFENKGKHHIPLLLKISTLQLI